MRSRRVGVHVHIMQTIGWLMIVLFDVLFYGVWPTFRRAIDEENWPIAGANLNTTCFGDSLLL